MRGVVVVLTALLLATSVVAQAANTPPGRAAAIQSVAPLQDHSEQSVTTAIKEAVVVAAQKARTMGLSWVQVREAYVLEDKVVVLVLATDTEPGEEEDERAPRGQRSL